MTAAQAWMAWVDEQLADRGWSRYRLAQEIGTAPQTVGRWGTLEEPPRPETLRAVSTALDVPMGDVLVAAGVLSPDELGVAGVPAAISADPALDDAGRRAMRAVYRALTES